jgi:hypothetical protein
VRVRDQGPEENRPSVVPPSLASMGDLVRVVGSVVLELTYRHTEIIGYQRLVSPFLVFIGKTVVTNDKKIGHRMGASVPIIVQLVMEVLKGNYKVALRNHLIQLFVFLHHTTLDIGEDLPHLLQSSSVQTQEVFCRCGSEDETD